MCSLMTGITWSGDQASDGWGWKNDGGWEWGNVGGWEWVGVGLGVLLSQELVGTWGVHHWSTAVLTLDLLFCLFIKCSKEEEEAAISQC